MRSRGASGKIQHATAVAVTAPIIIMLAGTLAAAGIIELGRKKQKDRSSTYTLTVDGVTHVDNGDPNTAELILDRLVSNFDPNDFTFVRIVDPTDPNRNGYTVTLSDETEPVLLEITVDDPNDGIVGGLSNLPSNPVGQGSVPVYNYLALDDVSGDSLAGPGMATATIIVERETGPKVVCTVFTNTGDVDKVNEDLVTCLDATPGLVVTPRAPKAQARVKVRSPGNRIVSVQSQSDDKKTTLFHVRTVGSERRQGPVPTVSEWGLVVLAILLITAGLFALRRRAGPGRLSH
jgi:hypothetical protein